MSAPVRLRAAIYPHMVKEGVLSLRDGSLAASANHAVYFLGAILAMRARPQRAPAVPVACGRHGTVPGRTGLADACLAHRDVARRGGRQRAGRRGLARPERRYGL